MHVRPFSHLENREFDWTEEVCEGSNQEWIIFRILQENISFKLAYSNDAFDGKSTDPSENTAEHEERRDLIRTIHEWMQQNRITGIKYKSMQFSRRFEGMNGDIIERGQKE